MNIQVTDDIKNKWPQYEFIGKPFVLENGKTYIRAKHRVWWQNHTHIYCIEDNWFWHEMSIQDILSVK